MTKKILILYTSVGLGHKFIAENIAFHLKQSGDEVLLHDILEVEEGVLVDFGVLLHSFINRRLPFVWRWLYFSNLVNLISLPLRVPLAKANSEKLSVIVEQFQPDCIISTQTTASAATASLIEQDRFRGKFVIAFSDYHLHKFWLYDHADLYLANIEEQKNEMMALGVPEEKIAVCGITLKPLQQVDEPQLRSQLGISADQQIVIFGSGSLGIGFDFSLLKTYLHLLTLNNDHVTVVVLCGKNNELKTKLEDLHLKNVKPLGFYSNPQELYQIAKVLVTKPGGLTIAEALQAGANILITHTLPGQEEPNYEYLLKHGLVEPIPQPLSAKKLAEATLALIRGDRNSETPNASHITQKGQEGQVLKTALLRLFS